MRITVVGGGPGGLYFALLTKKARPDWVIEVHEQNRADDTFGFGVVFSDDTLDEFLSRDPESYEKIRDNFAYWDDIAIHYKGETLRCAGNGFCGTSRVKLLNTLQERCREVGVAMTFGERTSPTCWRRASRIPTSSLLPTGSLRRSASISRRVSSRPCR